MKKQLFTAMALLGSISASATTTGTQMSFADNDTTIINKARQVVIVTSDSIQKVEVIGKEDNENFHYENHIQLVDSNYVSEVKIDRNWDVCIKVGRKKSEDMEARHMIMGPHIGLGFSAPTAVEPSEELDFKPFQSTEMWFTLLEYEYHPRLKQKNHAHWFSAGLGMDWRHYRTKDSKMFYKGENNNILLGDYPEGTTSRYSQINLFSITMPLLWHETFGKKLSWGVSLGAVLNFNVHSSIKTHYKFGKEDYTVSTSHAHQRPFSVDFMAKFRTPFFLDFYVKYSPFDVLKDHRGPKFKSLTFGFYL